MTKREYAAFKALCWAVEAAMQMDVTPSKEQVVKSAVIYGEVAGVTEGDVRRVIEMKVGDVMELR